MERAEMGRLIKGGNKGHARRGFVRTGTEGRPTQAIHEAKRDRRSRQRPPSVEGRAGYDREDPRRVRRTGPTTAQKRHGTRLAAPHCGLARPEPRGGSHHEPPLLLR
jgi:hypothetical protein